MKNEIDQKYLTPLFEIRGYGYETKLYLMGIDIAQVATEFTVKLDSDEKTISMKLDLKRLANEFYKDKANSGLIIR